MMNTLILDGSDQQLSVGFDSDVQGSAGSETLLIEDGPNVSFTPQSGDRVDVAQPLANYTIARTGLTELTLTDSDGNEAIKLTVNTGEDFELRFANGNTTVNLNNNQEITVGSEVLAETGDEVNEENLQLGPDESEVGGAEPSISNVDADPDPVDEGSSTTLTVNTSDIDDGATVNYGLTGNGINAVDFDGPLSGSIEINNNSGTLELPVVADEATEGQETFTANLSFVDGAQAAVEDPIIGFDESRAGGDASGFFLENASPLNVPDASSEVSILADASAPEVAVDAANGTATLSGIDLLLSPELALALGDDSLAGTDIGDVQIDAELTPSGDNFAVSGGTTSVSLAASALETLGLELAANNTPDEPAAGLDFGFSINNDDDNPLVVAPDGTPVGGDVNHSGQAVLKEAGAEVIEATEEVAINDTSVAVGEVTEVSSDVATVNETDNNTVNFTIETENASEGDTVNLIFDGDIDADDIEGELPQETSVGPNNQASVELSFAADSSDEGPENFTLSAAIGEEDPIASGQITVEDTSTSTQAVEPENDSTSFDATTGDLTFDFATGNYGVAINGFDGSDVLDVADLNNPGVTVLPDQDQQDGEQTIAFDDPENGNIVNVTLGDLTSEQDSAIFNQPTFIEEFGEDSLVLS